MFSKIEALLDRPGALVGLFLPFSLKLFFSFLSPAIPVVYRYTTTYHLCIIFNDFVSALGREEMNGVDGRERRERKTRGDEKYRSKNGCAAPPRSGSGIPSASDEVSHHCVSTSRLAYQLQFNQRNRTRNTAAYIDRHPPTFSLPLPVPLLDIKRHILTKNERC